MGVLTGMSGRALEWHSRGQRFDPAYLHQTKPVGLCLQVFPIFPIHRRGRHWDRRFCPGFECWPYVTSLYFSAKACSGVARYAMPLRAFFHFPPVFSPLQFFRIRGVLCLSLPKRRGVAVDFLRNDQLLSFASTNHLSPSWKRNGLVNIRLDPKSKE